MYTSSTTKRSPRTSRWRPARAGLPPGKGFRRAVTAGAAAAAAVAVTALGLTGAGASIAAPSMTQSAHATSQAGSVTCASWRIIKTVKGAVGC